MRSVCAAVSGPVNFMAGIRGRSFTVAEMAAAAREVKDAGTFAYLDQALTTPELNASMQG